MHEEIHLLDVLRREIGGEIRPFTSPAMRTGKAETSKCVIRPMPERPLTMPSQREASPPFSFLDQSNRPIGYSLELCEAIVEEIGIAVDDDALKIEYVKVTSESRIPAVVEGKIDLECGSTTANAERARRVAPFSPLIFVAGTKLMVPKAAPVSGITDLKGKTVVVTKGTTNEQAIAAATTRSSRSASPS